jgi:L-rhamnose-H+ transport protein
MGTSILPFVLVIFASFFQGTFGLGMKYMKPLSWEAWWLVHVFIAMFIFPVSWAFFAVPDLFGAISATPPDVIFKAMLYGFLWGIGGILFSVCVTSIGVSITYGIVMGLASAAGSLIPLFQIQNATSFPAFPFILIGVGVMLIGVAVTVMAGIQRDKIQSFAIGEAAGLKKGKAFQIGLVIAIVCGLLSSFLNVGFANAAPIAGEAENLGALTRNSSLAAWVVVLWGAIIMNAGYALYKLMANKSFRTFITPGSGKAYLWAIFAGICWFGALGIYGQGAALLGKIGPVIGWPILLGLSLIVSNFWAYKAGEWKNAKKPFQLMEIGLAVLIVACIILGYSNHVA